MEDVQPKIPKIIMQTWKTDVIPERWEESQRSIAKYMPSWKYVLMTDKTNRELVEKEFPDFLPYYDAFPYNIQRADAVRACWLYKYGGVYMDLDLVLLKDITDLFVPDVDAFFVASGNVAGVITNSFMASKPGNPLWLEYIEEMKKGPSSWAYGKHFNVMTSTGPMALSRTLKNTNTIYAVLPTKLVMPCSVCNIEMCNTEHAYIKPIRGQSWNDWTSHALNTCMCKWRYIVAVIITIIIFLIALWISRCWSV